MSFPALSEPYDQNNLLDRLSDPETLEVHYDQEYRRERELLDRRLALRSAAMCLSVGCGWHPGRHLFPAPAFRMTGVELDGAVVDALVESGDLDEGIAGRAASCPFATRPSTSCSTGSCCTTSPSRGRCGPCSTRPGGCCARVARWWPSSRASGTRWALRWPWPTGWGSGPVVHGTPDDMPLSPAALMREARAAGLEPELHGVTYGWRGCRRCSSAPHSASTRSARGRAPRPLPTRS